MIDNNYYMTMLKKDRAFPVKINGKLKCFITYFIGNGNIDKYVRDDPWSIVDDEPKTGDTVYVDQCVSDKGSENHKYNKIVFGMFIKHVKNNFPKVTKLRWNRFKNGVVHVYKKEI